MRRARAPGGLFLIASWCAVASAQTAPTTSPVAGPLTAPATAPSLESLPFRTDSTNPQLPWYQLQPGVFPPVHSEHRVRGQLVEADYIFRRGQFRTDGTGELISFRLMPYAVLQYHGAEADLRDIPLETELTFFTYQDSTGAFTQVAALQDDFTLAGKSDASTDEQRKRHAKFIADRGVAGWIDRVEGKRIVVSFFGDAAGQQIFYKDEHIDPEQYVKEQKRIHTVVANQELRTYNPPVDGQGSNVISYAMVPTDTYGSSGLQFTLEPGLLLEGFRRGHIVRVFLNQAWPHEDMPYGEKVYDEGDQHLAEPSPNQYPFRTDFGNEELPWFAYKPGQFVPWGAEHNIWGELVSVDLAHRRGKFRTDVTAEMVEFTMPPAGTVQYLNADAELSDLPIGTRYQFSMLQDTSGKFTRAIQIRDDFTFLQEDPVSRRVEAPGNGDSFFLATHLPTRKDEKDHVVQPPDLGHGVYTIDAQTQIIKAGQHLAAKDLVVGDDLLMNQTGATAQSRGRMTQVWVGADCQKAATDQQRDKHAAFLKQQGMPACIESVDGETITLNLIAANRKDFGQVLNGDPWGKPIFVIRADDTLHTTGPEILKFGMKDHTPELNTFNTFGCSGVRWRLELKPVPADLKPGMIVRVFKDDWTLPAVTPTTSPATAP